MDTPFNFSPDDDDHDNGRVVTEKTPLFAAGSAMAVLRDTPSTSAAPPTMAPIPAEPAEEPQYETLPDSPPNGRGGGDDIAEMEDGITAVFPMRPTGAPPGVAGLVSSALAEAGELVKFLFIIPLAGKDAIPTLQAMGMAATLGITTILFALFADNLLDVLFWCNNLLYAAILGIPLPPVSHVLLFIPEKITWILSMVQLLGLPIVILMMLITIASYPTTKWFLAWKHFTYIEALERRNDEVETLEDMLPPGTVDPMSEHIEVPTPPETPAIAPPPPVPAKPVSKGKKRRQKDSKKGKGKKPSPPEPATTVSPPPKPWTTEQLKWASTPYKQRATHFCRWIARTIRSSKGGPALAFTEGNNLVVRRRIAAIFQERHVRTSQWGRLMELTVTLVFTPTCYELASIQALEVQHAASLTIIPQLFWFLRSKYEHFSGADLDLARRYSRLCKRDF